MFRIIHFEYKFKEYITITDDEEADANDFITSGGELITDTIIEDDLPATFPTNSTFEKTF
jgi:hypothetical protein